MAWVTRAELASPRINFSPLPRLLNSLGGINFPLIKGKVMQGIRGAHVPLIPSPL
jgi:hypothetical protein